MSKVLYKIFEYGYIALALFSGYLVFSYWETERDQAYLFMFFGVLAVFMYFFKRRFRRKLEERNRDGNA